MLTVTTKGSTDANLAPLIHGKGKVAYLRPITPEDHERFSGAVQVNISREARELHRARLLVHETDRLRHERVRTIKEQLLQGIYRVDAGAVAKAIVRSEISRLLGNE
jgi:flagellar biosynthesis anti-sigma factor FlgM